MWGRLLEKSWLAGCFTCLSREQLSELRCLGVVLSSVAVAEPLSSRLDEYLGTYVR